jgi:2-succinyl-5-enolpyruvyl-6-hydroxy-3-cyclohexene-1-carboxylate synthase
VEASVQLEPRSAANRNYAFAAALFEEFVASGVEHVCLCPGSRSAPLAVGAARTPGLRVWVHLDERAAAFFALGLARAARAPVALVCSSGTAAANFLPAVVEACYGRVPLLVLTADRPPEVRGWGAAQTIDQVNLFGSHVRWFSEASPPGPTAWDGAGLRHARALACRAVASAVGPPPGPVHLNLPFREPLDPSPDPGEAASPVLESDPMPRGRGSDPYTRSWRSAPPPSPDLVSHLLEASLRARRGVIVCGPGDADPALPDAVARLGRATGWPVLAESTSQIRCGPHTRGVPILASFDAILRHHGFALEHAPDLVLRIGAPPTSKAFQQWLDLHRNARLVILDPDRTWSDPDHLASEVIDADPVRLCDSLERRLRRRPSPPGCPRWLEDWTSAEKRARQVVESRAGLRARLLAPQVVAVLAESLPDGATLFVSNSMAVRDLDAFLPVSTRRIRVLANRGANGIDGIVSSALGAAAEASGPLVLLTGDLAFLHDAGGLFAAHQHRIRASIVVLNDDGGGIFSLLPIAAHGDDVDFERLFTLPHGVDIAAVAGAYGLQHQKVTSGPDLSRALENSQASAGTQVIEVVVDRHENLALYREVHQDICRSLGAGGSR